MEVVVAVNEFLDRVRAFLYSQWRTGFDKDTESKLLTNCRPTAGIEKAKAAGRSAVASRIDSQTTDRSLMLHMVAFAMSNRSVSRMKMMSEGGKKISHITIRFQE
jgi:hypothetical protein